jgi:A/G-specific adenine glycosylase
MPGIFNQALMDFGATICKPQLPLCNTCPMAKKCEAYKNNLVSILPIKEKFIIKKIRWLNYLIVEHDWYIYVRKRGPKDIWENLYEFTLIESEGALEVEKLTQLKTMRTITGNHAFEINHISVIYKQQLTHQTIYGQFIKVKLTNAPNLPGFEKISSFDLQKLPFPKFITTYLKDKNVSLNLF